MLHLRLFGGLSLEADGRPAPTETLTQGRLAILAVIAVAGKKGISRDRLLGLLWPDSSETHAKGALKQALYTIRQALGEPAILLGTSTLRLNPDVIRSDVAEFRQAIDAGELQRAVAFYDGPLLDGVFPDGGAELEQWLDGERARLTAAWARALERLADERSAAGDPEAAVDAWRRLTIADPLSGRYARGLMMALADADDREAAIAYAATHARLVRDELAAEPDAEVLQLADRLRDAGPTIPVGAHVPVAHAGSRQRSPTRPPTPNGPAQPGGLAPDARPIEGPVVRRSRRGLAIGLTTVGLGGIVLFATTLPRGDAGSGPSRVLVASFENRTGDPSLDPLGLIAADWIAQGLQQTGLAEVVDPVSTLMVARRDAGQGVDSGVERAAAMAKDAGARLVVWGSVYKQGDSLVYRSSISDVASRRQLAALDPIVSASSNPVDGADRLRQSVAGALASVLDRRIASISAPGSHPPDFAAYREFISGLEVFQGSSRYDQAHAHFQEAARLDTTFSLPLVWDVFALRNSGRSAEADSVTMVLAARRARLSPTDRHSLDYFLSQMRGDHAGALQASRDAADLNPGSHWSHNASNRLLASNRPGEALRYLRQIDPEHGWAGAWFPFWKNLTIALHRSGEHREELVAARRALQLRPQEQSFVGLEMRALIALGRVDEAERRAHEMLAMVPTLNPPGDVLKVTSQELLQHGHAAAADRIAKLAIDWFRSPAAEQDARTRGAPTVRYAEGRALYEAGAWQEAEVVFESLPGYALDRRIYHGLFAAKRNERAEAEETIRQLLAETPRNGWAIYGAAKIAAALGDAERAVRLLTDVFACCSNEDIPTHLHRDRDWLALRDNKAFEELFRPKD